MNIRKIDDSTSLKLKELMKTIEGTCNPDEMKKARKIFKIYFDRVEIYRKKNPEILTKALRSFFKNYED